MNFVGGWVNSHDLVYLEWLSGEVFSKFFGSFLTLFDTLPFGFFISFLALGVVEVLDVFHTRDLVPELLRKFLRLLHVRNLKSLSFMLVLSFTPFVLMLFVLLIWRPRRFKNFNLGKDHSLILGHCIRHRWVQNFLVLLIGLLRNKRQGIDVRLAGLSHISNQTNRSLLLQPLFGKSLLKVVRLRLKHRNSEVLFKQ